MGLDNKGPCDTTNKKGRPCDDAYFCYLPYNPANASDVSGGTCCLYPTSPSPRPSMILIILKLRLFT